MPFIIVRLGSKVSFSKFEDLRTSTELWHILSKQKGYCSNFFARERHFCILYMAMKLILKKQLDTPSKNHAFILSLQCFWCMNELLAIKSLFHLWSLPFDDFIGLKKSDSYFLSTVLDPSLLFTRILRQYCCSLVSHFIGVKYSSQM